MCYEEDDSCEVFVERDCVSAVHGENPWLGLEWVKQV